MRRWMIRLALGCLIGLLALAGGWAPAMAARDGSDAAWATIRAKVPADQPLYRPTWLPERFRQPGQAATTGPIIGVGYTSDEGDNLLFIYGPSNSCATPERGLPAPILIHGIKGELAVLPESCYPQITVDWVQGGGQYTIAGNRAGTGQAAVNREEMLRIVAGLALVGPDGAPVAGPPNRGARGPSASRRPGSARPAPSSTTGGGMAGWRAMAIR